MNNKIAIQSALVLVLLFCLAGILLSFGNPGSTAYPSQQLECAWFRFKF